MQGAILVDLSDLVKALAKFHYNNLHILLEELLNDIQSCDGFTAPCGGDYNSIASRNTLFLFIPDINEHGSIEDPIFKVNTLRVAPAEGIARREAEAYIKVTHDIKLARKVCFPSQNRANKELIQALVRGHVEAEPRVGQSTLYLVGSPIE